MRRKRSQSHPPSGGRITPQDVQDVEFRLAFRGYDERDVDAFLDRVTEDLAAYLEELERLRAAASSGATASDLTAARSEADRIIAEARREAERILADARARARAIEAGGSDLRAALAPFLNREREFLQSLGGLVQSHAEEIKAMVQELRARAEERPAEPPRPASEPAGGSEHERGPSPEEAFAPIGVPGGEEPTPEVGEDPRRNDLRRDSGERSLRELFFGED
ncbi:Cell cycle protein GpsB [bacterium HR12]|nr:Cell cycle protein GpsB [bacterium HR12]